MGPVTHTPPPTQTHLHIDLFTQSQPNWKTTITRKKNFSNFFGRGFSIHVVISPSKLWLPLFFSMPEYKVNTWGWVFTHVVRNLSYRAYFWEHVITVVWGRNVFFRSDVVLHQHRAASLLMHHVAVSLLFRALYPEEMFIAVLPLWPRPLETKEPNDENVCVLQGIFSHPVFYSAINTTQFLPCVIFLLFRRAVLSNHQMMEKKSWFRCVNWSKRSCAVKYAVFLTELVCKINNCIVQIVFSRMFWVYCI